MPQVQAEKKEASASPQTQLPIAQAKTLPSLPGVDKSQRTPNGQRESSFPDAILKKAQLHGFGPTEIKIEEGMYVGCKGNICFPLGKVETRGPEVAKNPYIGMAPGLVLKFVDSGPAITVTLGPPTFQKDHISATGAFGKVSRNQDGTFNLQLKEGYKGKVEVIGGARQQFDSMDRIDQAAIEKFKKVNAGMTDEQARAALARGILQSNGNQPVLFIGTVPSQCAPCRQLEPVLDQVAAQLQPGAGRIVVIEYSDFATGIADLGEGAKFPTVMVLGKLLGKLKNGVASVPPILMNSGRAVAESHDGMFRAETLIQKLQAVR